MLYTLRCTNCRHVFDINMPMSQYIAFIETEDSFFVCPKCKIMTHPTRVIMYPVPAVYRGDGFTLKKEDNESSV